MQADRLKAAKRESSVSIDEYLQRQVSPMVALRELYELLEEYSPMWYSQETHDLAWAALAEHTIQ